MFNDKEYIHLCTPQNRMHFSSCCPILYPLNVKVALMSDPDLAQAGKDFSDALEAEKRISEQVVMPPCFGAT